MANDRDALDMISQLVDKYGESAKDIIVNGLNLESKGYNRYKCPNIHDHKNGDSNPSMGWVSKGNYFNCLGCKKTINIYSYYKDYMNYTFNEIMTTDGIIKIEENRKKFKDGIEKKTKLTTEQQEYIFNRGLTKETAKHFKLVNIEDAVGIPYFKNGVLVGIKKRMLTGKIKNLSVTGSKFFLLNSDETDPNESLIVTEGEWDAMILWQEGFKNVISVGCGANATATLFEQAEDYFKKFNEIILFTDNDKYGDEMDKAFLDNFEGKVATVDKALYNGCKDANEIFLKHGATQLKKVVASGKVSFDGEWDIDANPYICLDPKDVKFIPTSLKTLDESINMIQSKMVTLVTGRSNAGKSTFVSQLMVSAIDKNFKVYMVIGEGNKDKIINKFYTSLIGSDSKYYDIKMFNIREIKEPKERTLKAIQQWHKGKLKLFVKSLSKYKTEKQLFEMLEYKIRTEKYDMVVLDNLMSLMTVSNSQDKNDSQAMFVEMCHHLAESTNCAIILVLHPNKSYKKGEEMDFEQISGTGDISNKADVIINVIRVPDKEVGDDAVTNKIQVAKNRDYPELPTIDCAFDKETFTVCEMQNGVAKAKTFVGWKKYYQEEATLPKISRS